MRTFAMLCALVALAGCATAPGVIADQKAQAASADCRAQRLAGQISGYAASFRCSGPRIRQAYAEAGYPYMDLMDALLTRRLVFAERADRGEMTEAELNAAVTELAANVRSEALQRDNLTAAADAQRSAAAAAIIGATRIQPLPMPTLSSPRTTNCFAAGPNINCTTW